MIPDTTPYLVFIRASIFGLRLVLPASITFTALRITGLLTSLPLPLEIIAYAEVVFYGLVSLPRQLQLNNSKPRSTTRTRSQRRQLFERWINSVPDLEACLRTYFRGARLEDVRRENVKDLFAWSIWSKKRGRVENDEELEQYLELTEERLQWKFKPGRGNVRPSQVSTDRMRVQHKPLLFYVIGIGGDDLLTYLTCCYMGLHHYRLPFSQLSAVFPLRSQTLLTRHVSSSKDLSYWYRPHKSKTRLPVLFIHGIGAGMRTYTGFLKAFIAHDTDNGEDGQVGIIALELMPISMRITKEVLPRAEMISQILRILDHHGWDRFTMTAHSYGSIIATHLLQEIPSHIGPMLLVDPVTLCIHWGDVPYNFIYRRPRKASEWQLHYFASTDMCIAHSITRAFDWTVNVLWKSDMRDRAITVVLAEEDIIMDTRGMVKDLVEDETLSTRVYDSKDLIPSYNRGAQRSEGRDGNTVDVIWYEGLNHAGVFDEAKDWAPLVHVLWRYAGRDRR